MSIKYLNHVWDFKSDNSGQKIVLLALADHANDEGVCWPGVDRLAVKCDMTERNVQKHLAALAQKGIITIEHNKGTKTASGWTNRYDIRGVTQFTPCEGVSPSSPDGVSPSSPDGVSPSSPKPSVEPSVEPPKGDYLDAVFAAAGNSNGQQPYTEPSAMDQFFGSYRDEVLNIWADISGSLPRGQLKEDLIGLALQPNFTPEKFKDFFSAYKRGGGSPYNFDKIQQGYNAHTPPPAARKKVQILNKFTNQYETVEI